MDFVIFSDQCGKKCCCCHKVMGDPVTDKQYAKIWTPVGILAVCLIVVIWACIEGITNNAEMHDHIFADEDSVRAAVNNLFDQVIDRFEAVEPTAEFVIDFSVSIINDVFEIIEDNTDGIGGAVDDLYTALDIISANYTNGVNISGQFVNPFNDSQSEELSFYRCI